MDNERFFKPAIDNFGAVDEVIDGWMLPDGSCLCWPNQDHRYIGHWCQNGWTEFIAKGAASLLFDLGDYIAIRTTGLSTEQRMAFQRLFEKHPNQEFREAYWVTYDENGNQLEAESMHTPGLIQLRLTDTVAYNLEMAHYAREQEILEDLDDPMEEL